MLTGANECCAGILGREIRTTNCVVSRGNVQISTVFIHLTDSKSVNKLTLVFMVLLLMHKQAYLVQKHRNLAVFQLSSSNPNFHRVGNPKVMGLKHPAFHVTSLCLYLCFLLNKAFIHLYQQLNHSSEKEMGKGCVSEQRP